MDRKRYRPAVAVWNFRERDKYVELLGELKVPLYRLPRNHSGVEKLLAFRHVIREVKPEIVSSYASYLNFAVQCGVIGTGTIAVGSVRSDLMRARKQAGWCLGALSARWPRNQVFNNMAAAKTVQQTGDFFAPKRISVVRNGICFEQFRLGPLPSTHRMCITGVGSLLPVKRWDRLILAAQDLRRAGLDCLVRICGDGPLRDSLRQQTEGLGLADAVEFRGYSDNIPALLADATILAHTSDAEGCPNAVMEAMATGRPVVATDVGDVSSIVDDHKTGFVVQPGDHSALVDRLARLIKDRELCRRMGEASRLKAEKEFSLERLVAETFAAYREAGWQG
jgi:glycosyltransferase involved in cell wall biosynthesis